MARAKIWEKHGMCLQEVTKGRLKAERSQKVSRAEDGVRAQHTCPYQGPFWRHWTNCKWYRSYQSGPPKLCPLRPQQPKQKMSSNETLQPLELRISLIIHEDAFKYVLYCFLLLLKLCKSLTKSKKWDKIKINSVINTSEYKRTP